MSESCTWCGQAPCACGIEPAVDVDIGLVAVPPGDPFASVPDAARSTQQPATRRVEVPFELLQLSMARLNDDHTSPVARPDFERADDDNDDDNNDVGAVDDRFDATDRFSMEALLGSAADAIVLGDPTNIVESVKLKLRNLDIDLDLDDSDLEPSDEGPATVEKQIFIGADVERLLTPMVVLERRPTAGDLSVLSPFERFVLEQIDGTRTCHDIQYAMGLSEGDLRIAVALLADKQLVQLASSSSSSSSSSPPPAPAETTVGDGLELSPFGHDDEPSGFGDAVEADVTVEVAMTPVTPPSSVGGEPVILPRTMTPLATPTPVTASEPVIAALPRPATNANIAAAVGRAPPPTTTMTALALLLNRAGRAEDEGDLAGAVELLREAIVLEPGSAVAFNRLGVLLARTRDLPGAVKALDRALQIKPDDATIRSNHAKIVSIADRKKPTKRR